MSTHEDEAFVELYEGEDLRLRGKVPLRPLVTQALHPSLGSLLIGARFKIMLVGLPDDEPVSGRPAMVNVRPGFGYLLIVGELGDGSLISKQHSIRRLLGPLLKRTAIEFDPAVGYWGYCVASPALASLPVARPAPQVEGTVEFDSGTVAPARFRVRPSAEDELPTFDLTKFGERAGRIGRLAVVLSEGVHDQLTETLPLSERMEVGGFLAGRAFRAEQRDQTWVVRIETVLPAQHAGASSLRFTFTGDSFREMNRAIDQLPDQRLVGWYHTHLFRAGGISGLSDTDVSLHFRTFQQPWQTAGLINYTEKRLLRFYIRDGEVMRTCPQWIGSDRDGYRAAGLEVGR